MWLLVQLYRQGAISAKHLCDVVEYQYSQRPNVGLLAVRSDMLSMRQLFQVLREQSTSQKQFGEIAIELSLLTRVQIAELLLQQTELTPSVRTALTELNILSEDEFEHALKMAHEVMNSPDRDLDSAQQAVAAPVPVPGAGNPPIPGNMAQ